MLHSLMISMFIENVQTPLWHFRTGTCSLPPYSSFRLKSIHDVRKPQKSNSYRTIDANHRRLYRVKNMLAMYLKYHKAGLTPTTPVTSIAISPVKMSIGRKSLTNLRSEMIFLQGKPVFFYIFLPSTPPC